MSNKVPQIRFNGYSDDWVQRKLADLSDGFSYGLNAASKEYDGVHGYLRITDIDEVSHSFLPEGLTSPNIPEDQLTDYRMDEQSIVYARTGASTGKTYIYRDSDGELYYAGFLIRQKVNKETSAQFVYQNTLTKAWERYVQVMSQRSGQPGINAQEVGRFELAIPERAEQDKIAHLFNSLDNLIAANQRKLDLLKEQKKGYLQKMFPKNGEKVPELRFAGFADDWEERKLGDVAQFNPKTVLPDEFEYVDLESVIGTEMISHRTESKDQAPSRAQRLAKKGDVFYQTVRPYQMNNYLYDLPYDNYVFSTGYAQMRPNIDSYFLLNSVQNKQFVQHVLDRSTGTSYPAINSSDLSNIEINVPPKLAEQQKIGSFFKQVDNTIALHQRKLDLMKEQKKGFLQKMFV